MPITTGVAFETVARFAADVRAGLSQPEQKQLPFKYFYDDVGSALFEVISVLPEYGLTRADERLLKKYANRIATSIPASVVVAELGSGSGKKARWLLEALSRLEPVTYCPVELSSAALAVCARELSDLDSVRVIALERDFLEGLSEVATRREDGQHLLVLFLGSSIGNFECENAVSLLTSIRATMKAGDALLLGTDLEKEVARIIAAYDDPLGVTAAFNLNLLARINRELDADFNLQNFKHHVKFNRQTRDVEMYLQSTCRQTVRINKAGFSTVLSAGESILTERSHKYSLDEVSAIIQEGGFRCQEQFVDREWPFAESLMFAE